MGIIYSQCLPETKMLKSNSNTWDIAPGKNMKTFKHD